MATEESKRMMQMLEALHKAFHKHCEIEAANQARATEVLETLKENVKALNSTLLRGSNGKSISERLTIVEQELKAIQRLEKKIASIKEQLDERQRLRLSFWGPVLCSLIGSVTAVVVALIALFGGG